LLKKAEVFETAVKPYRHYLCLLKIPKVAKSLAISLGDHLQRLIFLEKKGLGALVYRAPGSSLIVPRQNPGRREESRDPNRSDAIASARSRWC